MKKLITICFEKKATFFSAVSILILLTALAQGQNLFEADYGSGNIYEFTNNNGSLSSTPTTFASGLLRPTGLAFDSAGNLFVGEVGKPVVPGNIYEFTPGGTRSTLASGSRPWGLAFDSAGNLFEAYHNGNIYEFTPGGTQSTFATGLNEPWGLAFQPVPEPATLLLLGLGGLALLRRHRCKETRRHKNVLDSQRILLRKDE